MVLWKARKAGECLKSTALRVRVGTRPGNQLNYAVNGEPLQAVLTERNVLKESDIISLTAISKVLRACRWYVVLDL